MDGSGDLHLTLPVDCIRSLDRLAGACGVKRVQLLRLAVGRFISGAKRDERDAEMRAYVSDMAAHSGEFVRQTNAQVRRLPREETE